MSSTEYPVPTLASTPRRPGQKTRIGDLGHDLPRAFADARRHHPGPGRPAAEAAQKPAKICGAASTLSPGDVYRARVASSQAAGKAPVGKGMGFIRTLCRGWPVFSGRCSLAGVLWPVFYVRDPLLL